MTGAAGWRSLAVTVLLVFASSAQAFSFCFSFGGGNSHRGNAGFYNFPPPGMGPAFYPGYPYSPVPPTLLYGAYPPPSESAGRAEADDAAPATAPRPTLGWPK